MKEEEGSLRLGKGGKQGFNGLDFLIHILFNIIYVIN